MMLYDIIYVTYIAETKPVKREAIVTYTVDRLFIGFSELLSSCASRRISQLLKIFLIYFSIMENMM